MHHASSITPRFDGFPWSDEYVQVVVSDPRAVVSGKGGLCCGSGIHLTLTMNRAEVVELLEAVYSARPVSWDEQPPPPSSEHSLRVVV